MASASAGVGSALPDQTSATSGWVLQTDGTAASWVAASAASLPAQGGQSGKFLTTNGTVASWDVVSATSLLPDQTGNSGKVLSTDGLGALSWIDASGLTLGNFGSTPSAKGASFSAGTLTMEPADGTNPGLVSATTQTFGGTKTIGGAVLNATGFAATFPAITWGVVGFAGDTGNGHAYAIINVAGGGQFRVWDGAAANLMLLGGTSMDLTGLGNSGSIKLKDDLGAVKTATISGGVWVIT